VIQKQQNIGEGRVRKTKYLKDLRGGVPRKAPLSPGKKGQSTGGGIRILRGGKKLGGECIRDEGI